MNNASNLYFVKPIPIDVNSNSKPFEVLIEENIASVLTFKPNKITYRSEVYFLRSAYVRLLSESGFCKNHPNESFHLNYNNAVITGFPVKSSPYYLRALVVANLKNDVTEYSVLSHFVQFRPSHVVLISSISGNTQCAIVEFDQIRDRDAAFIRSERIHGTVFYLFPSFDQINTTLPASAKYEPRPLLPTTHLPTDFVFIHNRNQYISHCNRVKQICTTFFEHNFVTIPDFSGDFRDLQRYIDGDSLEINESNVTFLFNTGNFLGISQLTSIDPFSYLTLNNVISMAHDMENLIDIVPLTSFITKHLAELTESQRLRLLPIKVISQCVESPVQLSIKIDPCQLLMQLPKDTENQTPLASLIQYRTIDIPEMKVVLNNPNIDLDKFHDNFLHDFLHVANAPPYILCEYQGNPFNGIFAYLRTLCHDNPDTAGLVHLEASSTQVSSVHVILNYASNNYFGTRDLSDQWIRFHFLRHKVSLSGYSYQTHNINANGHTQSWKLEGSIDGINWTIIHEMRNSSVLAQLNAVYTTDFPSTPFYSLFKMTQTGPNTLGYNNFRVAHIEFFGKIEEL